MRLLRIAQVIGYGLMHKQSTINAESDQLNPGRQPG